MISSLIERLRAAQKTFRLRIFFIRQRQLEFAKKRAEDAEYEWRVYLFNCNEWKRQCRMNLCDGCGHRDDEYRGPQRCSLGY